MGVGGRRRRGGGRLSVVAVGMLLAAACSAGSNVAIQAPAGSGPTGTDPSRASGEPTPQVGDCRAPLDHAIIDAASDPRPTVDCSAAHGSETFWVGLMSSTIEAWPGSDDRAGALLETQVTRECRTRHLQYLGLDAGASLKLPPDRLQSFAFFVPTERDFQDGARWFRCDAVVEPLAAERTSIDGTLKDVYAKPLPVSYRLCEARLGQPVACDQDHEIEYLASVLLDSLSQFPTQKGDLQVTAACRTPLLTALGLTEERTDLVFGYLLPTQEAWDAGNRLATCVVGVADGSSLQGTLADIGPSAPLPKG
jgi:hypothetical protein